MTHNFEEENRLFQSGYIKGYHDAVMRCPDIVRCKDCKHRHSLTGTCVNIDGACFQSYVGDDWFCADGERKEGDGTQH